MAGPQEHPLIGLTVARVRSITDEELTASGWEHYIEHMDRSFFCVLELDDGSLLFSMGDPEGNGPGVLIHQSEGSEFYVQEIG